MHPGVMGLHPGAEVLGKTDFNLIAPNTPNALESQDEDTISRGDIQDKLAPSNCSVCLLPRDRRTLVKLLPLF